MPSVEVGTVEIAGVTCIIEAMASKYGGTWYLYDAHEDAESRTMLGQGDTMDQAMQRARVALAKRKVKVEVKFRTAVGEHGVAHGIHAKNRTVLARLDGEAIQLESYRRNSDLRADTPQEKIDRLIEIAEQVKALDSERYTILKEYEFDVRKAVEAAIDEKLAEQADNASA